MPAVCKRCGKQPVEPPTWLCAACEHAAHTEAAAGQAQLELWMRHRGLFAEWLIEHGHDPSIV